MSLQSFLCLNDIEYFHCIRTSSRTSSVSIFHSVLLLASLNIVDKTVTLKGFITARHVVWFVNFQKKKYFITFINDSLQSILVPTILVNIFAYDLRSLFEWYQ